MRVFREYEAKHLLKREIIKYVDEEGGTFQSTLMVEFQGGRGWGRGVIFEAMEEMGILNDPDYLLELEEMRRDGGYTKNAQFVEVPEWRT